MPNYVYNGAFIQTQKDRVQSFWIGRLLEGSMPEECMEALLLFPLLTLCLSALCLFISILCNKLEFVSLSSESQPSKSIKWRRGSWEP